MASITELMKQDSISNSDSLLHDIDSRIKLIVLVLIIIFAVSSENYIVFAAVEAYLLILIYLSNISIKEALMRVALIIPFGLFIALFQPFIQPGDIIYNLPLGIHITQQGIAFAELLLARLVISVTSVVLFSYITPMQDVAEAFRKLHIANEFAMIFSLFVRFLFLFFDELQNLRQAQASRCHGLSSDLPYMWRLKNAGYLVLMMFLRAYEKGEVVFESMLCRGYSSESKLYTDNERLSNKSIAYLLITILLMVVLLLLQYLAII